MKISVVVPAYNEEKYLHLTLESLQKLTRKPDEILVVDGGSTDKTAEIAKQHGARVITIPHRGIGFAREQGLEAATGDIVAYTDADTVVPSDWLTNIENDLGKPGTSGVIGLYKVPDGWWFYRYFVNWLWPPLHRIFYWFGVPMAAGQNIAFHKNLGLAAGGFPVDFKLAEDVEMAVRLKTQGRVAFDPKITVTSSGRRGKEGIPLIWRNIKAFAIYAATGRATTIGFPDIR